MMKITIAQRLRVAAFVAISVTTSPGCGTNDSAPDGGSDAEPGDSGDVVTPRDAGIDVAMDSAPEDVGLSCSCEGRMCGTNACGEACGPGCGIGVSCVDGQCQTGCSDGQYECGGACVDLLSDPAHCGNCNNACPTTIAGSPVCIDAECDVRCGGIECPPDIPYCVFDACSPCPNETDCWHEESCLSHDETICADTEVLLRCQRGVIVEEPCPSVCFFRECV